MAAMAANWNRDDLEPRVRVILDRTVIPTLSRPACLAQSDA
jgi:hypothetical protein